MKKIVLVFCLIFSFQFGNAQEYDNAIGVRGGFNRGLTYKHFLGSNSAVELIAATRWAGLTLTGLYEIHADAFDVDGLKWFYGGGGHVGFFAGYYNHPYFKDDRSYMVIGVDGIIGLEYTIQEIPFSISVDWKPAFNLIGHTGFWGDQGALSVRYYW